MTKNILTHFIIFCATDLHGCCRLVKYKYASNISLTEVCHLMGEEIQVPVEFYADLETFLHIAEANPIFVSSIFHQVFLLNFCFLYTQTIFLRFPGSRLLGRRKLSKFHH